MKVELCDICKKNESDIHYKVKRSNKGMMVNYGNALIWEKSLWQPYKKIAVCQTCAENIIGAIHKMTIDELVNNTSK